MKNEKNKKLLRWKYNFLIINNQIIFHFSLFTFHLKCIRF